MCQSANGGTPLHRRRLINRHVIDNRGRSSMRLEPELLDALNEVCQRENIGPSELVRRIEQRATGGPTSAIRVYLLQYFREAATDQGHAAAGHGSREVALSA